MTSLSINFYPIEEQHEKELKYVVIQARHRGQWVFVRHKKRMTLEIPGGHIEENETPDQAAKRELYEESGATDFSLRPVCIYSVAREGEKESYGMLYFSDVEVLGDLPEYEMAEVKLSDRLPNNLTYELIQPYLFKRVEKYLQEIE